MRILFILLFISYLMGSCSEEKVEPFKRSESYLYFVKPEAGYQLRDSLYACYSPTTVSPRKLKDTVYVRVGVMGDVLKEASAIKLEQYTEKGDESLQATPGVDYVAFDAPEFRESMVMPVDSAAVNIPVVFTYDAESAADYNKATKTLSIRLAETDRFKVLALGTNAGLYRIQLKVYHSN